ncbi:MAG: NAD-dependent succinate-semialdehyde dehydrogenase [Actinomycetota bacterium]
MVASRQLWIAGESVGAADGTTFPVENPYSGEVVAHVARAGADDAHRAVDAATAALGDWAATSGNARANVLHRAYRLVSKYREELARLLVDEGGKIVAEAAKEVRTGGAFIRLAAEEARRLGGELLPAPDAAQRIVVAHRPVGVVAAFTPANAPVNVFGRKAACALGAGCTVVVKPPEETPLSTLLLVELLAEAGVPSGAVNVVVGDAPAIAGVLTTHPAVRLVTFTGSAHRGRQLMARAAEAGTPVILELGGVAPFVVFEDADLDAAVAGLVAAKFRMSGQICASPQRVIVQRGAADGFRDKLLRRVATLRFGDPDDPANDYGPLYHERILKGVEALVNDAVSKGATLLCGGTRGEGLLYPPTVITGVTPDMEVRREEAFGPILTLEEFGDEAEAVTLANDTDYGLGAYVFTADGSRGWRVAEAVQAGVVGVNEAFPVTIEGPFGGVKGSGFGREGGRYGIEEFLVTKQITFRI